jgi:hypothetical protein
MWAVLFITLPTQPNAVRLRIWRALKALGCAALRDGVYLLPEARAPQLEALGAEAREHGGDASVLLLSPRDGGQQADVLARFDRAELYAAWRETAATLLRELPGLSDTEARRRLRAASEELLAIGRVDYYPGAAAEQAQAEMQALRHAVDAHVANGEPQPRAEHGIARLDAAKFQGRRWATRARPWVDRLASAWLIQRFIDPQARFVWLADLARPPRGAVGFDYDGARFSHVGARVSFEVLAASFGLDADPRLQRIAAIVHFLDVGGIPAAEAPGLESVLTGLRELHADDDVLVAAAATVFDALHAAQGETT